EKSLRYELPYFGGELLSEKPTQGKTCLSMEEKRQAGNCYIRTPAGGRSARHREADRGGYGSRTRERHHPPRPQTREYQSHTGRQGEGAGLWLGEGVWWRRNEGRSFRVANADGRDARRDNPLHAPNSFSPDGQLLAFTDQRAETGRDIWVLNLKDSKAQPFLRTPYEESAPKFLLTGNGWPTLRTNRDTVRFMRGLIPAPPANGRFRPTAARSRCRTAMAANCFTAARTR